MNDIRRRKLLTLPICLLAPAGVALAQGGDHRGEAGNFPVKAVRFVVPFPPGGPADTMARRISEQLAKKWGQPVIVENIPGGHTTIGTNAVASAPPDGHTIGLVTGSHMTNPYLLGKLPYDTLKDLTGVMVLSRTHIAVYAHSSFPANTPAELIALARKDPDRAMYGSATALTTLGVELLNAMAGTAMKSVGYKGSADAVRDLLAGHLQLLVDPVQQSTLDHVKSGRIKLIGTTGATPSPFTPNAPVFASVVPGFDLSSAFGLITRAGTPAARVRRIRDDVAAVLLDPDISARLRSTGLEPIASTPEEYNAYIATEMKKWEPIAKATGLKLN